MYPIRLFNVLYITLLCFYVLGGTIELKTCAPLPTYSQLLSTKSATQCLVTPLKRLPYDVRNFDFVFVLEISYFVNQTRLLFVKETLHKLIDTTHNKNYGDINPQFAFVFYPITSNQSQLVATEFKKFYSHDEVDSLFKKLVDYAEHLEQFNASVSTNSLRHLTVLRSLEALADLTNDKPSAFLSIEGNQIAINYRENSEKHLVIFLDLFEKQNKKNSEHIIDKSKINNDIDNMVTLIKQRIDRSSKLVLAVVLDPANKIAMTTFGDPKYAQVYNDGTHFNKAMTLKALLKAKNEQSNTLQAHLLYKGVHMQVTRLKKLRDIYKFLNPAFWTTDGIYASFTNHCVGAYQCPHCSALHGCYRPKAIKAAHAEKFQMAADFATGGHEPVKASFASVTNNTKFAKEEQLTIYSQPLSAGSAVELSYVVDDEVPKLQWSPNRVFAETIVKKGRPVVLKNSTVSVWPALEKWTDDYLQKYLTNSSILQSVKCTNNFLTFDPDFRVSLKLNISIPFVTANMSKEEFFSCLHEECTDGYKGHYYFGEVPDQLKEDMKNDRFLYLTDKDYKTGKQFIWVSSAGMITHAHFDQDYNFFVQISGLKRFTLWTPVQYESLYIYPRVHPMWHKSRVNLREVDPQRFPLFLKSQALQVTVGPGDLLYVPPYTWHYVETLTPSVSLSTWSHDYRLYDHMRSIYKYDHKFDELANPKGLCVYVYMCLVKCVYVCVYICMFVCMYVRTYVCMCVCVCMYVCVYVCIYVCMYINCFISCLSILYPFHCSLSLACILSLRCKVCNCSSRCKSF